MDSTEFVNEPVNVNSSMDNKGHTTPQKLTWRNKQYTIVTVGRQWDETDGRYVLVETADGSRFELQLRRENLIWYLRKVWWGQIVA